MCCGGYEYPVAVSDHLLRIGLEKYMIQAVLLSGVMVAHTRTLLTCQPEECLRLS